MTRRDVCRRLAVLTREARSPWLIRAPLEASHMHNRTTFCEDAAPGAVWEYSE